MSSCVIVPVFLVPVIDSAGGQDWTWILPCVGKLLAPPGLSRYISCNLASGNLVSPLKIGRKEMGEIRGDMPHILLTQLILLKSVELSGYIWQMILKSSPMPLAWHKYTNFSLLTWKNYNPQLLKNNEDIICPDVSLPKRCSAAFSLSILGPSDGLTQDLPTVCVW